MNFLNWHNFSGPSFVDLLTYLSKLGFIKYFEIIILFSTYTMVHLTNSPGMLESWHAYASLHIILTYEYKFLLF